MRERGLDAAERRRLRLDLEELSDEEYIGKRATLLAMVKTVHTPFAADVREAIELEDKFRPRRK